jgi:hypothetical protein
LNLSANSFGDENDLGQDQRIDQSKAIEPIADVLGAQHHPGVEREQAENDKEIDENRDEALPHRGGSSASQKRRSRPPHQA